MKKKKLKAQLNQLIAEQNALEATLCSVVSDVCKIKKACEDLVTHINVRFAALTDGKSGERFR